MTRFVKATYHSAIKAAEFIAEDGRHCIRSGGSLPWRTHNAGNMVSPLVSGIPAPKKTKGYIGFAQAGVSNHYFFIFPDYETGRGELKASLLRKYSEKTLSETIKTYAPSTDNNDTDKYISDLSKMSGVAEDTKLKDLSNAQLNAVMDGIEKIEGYHANTDTRKETWVTVSHIQATNGTRPVADEEIVLKSGGKETTLKSNAVGEFPAIVHSKTPIEVHHKASDGTLKKVGQLPADKGQHFSLINRVRQMLATSGPVKAPENATKKKHPLTYTVQPADTLSKLAARFKTTVAKIKEDNHLSRDVIVPGQVLSIHESSPMAAPAATKPKKALPKTPATKPEATATPAKPKPVATAETQTLPARSKEGTGEPLALFMPDEGVAPWMKYAVAEAKLRKGMQEAEIEKKVNYHTVINDGGTSLVGKSNAWCAAFVNWCLMKAGYPIKNPKESGVYDIKYLMGRADGFIHVKHSKNEIHPEYANPLYIRITEPVYGAIAIVTTSAGHGHHAGLVCARAGANHVVILGGNQDDQIRFDDMNIEPVKKAKGVKERKDHMQFYIPASYIKTYNTNLAAKKLEYGKSTEFNKALGIKLEESKSIT